MIFYNLLTWIDAFYSDFSMAWLLNLRFFPPQFHRIETFYWQKLDFLVYQEYSQWEDWTYFERDEFSTYCWSSGIFTTSQLPLEDGLKTENIRSQLQLLGRKMPLWCQRSEVRMDRTVGDHWTATGTQITNQDCRTAFLNTQNVQPEAVCINN